MRISRYILSFLCPVLLFSAGAVHGGDMENLKANLKKHVVKLCDEIGERNYVYYASLEEAADYIASEFKRYGYDLQLQSYDIEGRDYQNIIATKKGNKRPEEVVIIGAHYDSVIGSPGANDNGSGVSALLELARLSSGMETGRTIKFIAFVNEEPPFFLSDDMGSRVYARDAKKRSEDIKAMLCLETIGYYSERRNSQSYPLFYGLFYPDQANFIGVVGNFASRSLVAEVTDTFRKNSDFNIEAIVAPAFVPGVNFSDQDSFWRYGYKGAMITDTAFYRYPYYHTMDDTYEKIDYDKLTEVVKGLYYVVIELAK